MNYGSTNHCRPNRPLERSVKRRRRLVAVARCAPRPFSCVVRRHKQAFWQWRRIWIMKVSTGRVVEGKVVLEGEPPAEGSVVTVVAREDDDAFDVTPEEERALLEAIAQAHRGQVVSWEELREQLRRLG
jgi:hypothetical protein